jgi:uncharacterized Zn-finger protein
VPEEVVPHFHNDPGVPVIEIGAKKFMCVGALPPQDHPHVYCDMGDAIEYVCPYCATLYRHNPALASAPGGMRISRRDRSLEQRARMIGEWLQAHKVRTTRCRGWSSEQGQLGN